MALNLLRTAWSEGGPPLGNDSHFASMSRLLALTWRFLLAVGLVFNPVVGAGMAMASAKAPPCHHQMAMSADMKHQCGDCSHAGCQYAACCLAGALDLPLLSFVVGPASSQAAHARHPSGATAPPPSRMIRPPIG